MYYVEYTVSLTTSSVVTAALDKEDHAPLDIDEMIHAEEILLNDPDFIAVVKRLNLPEGASVVADSWPVSAALDPSLTS